MWAWDQHKTKLQEKESQPSVTWWEAEDRNELPSQDLKLYPSAYPRLSSISALHGNLRGDSHLTRSIKGHYKPVGSQRKSFATLEIPSINMKQVQMQSTEVVCYWILNDIYRPQKRAAGGLDDAGTNTGVELVMDKLPLAQFRIYLIFMSSH